MSFLFELLFDVHRFEVLDEVVHFIVGLILKLVDGDYLLYEFLNFVDDVLSLLHFEDVLFLRVEMMRDCATFGCRTWFRGTHFHETDNNRKLCYFG